MTVYVDRIQKMFPKDPKARRLGNRWCHLFADSEIELMAFAIDIGLRKEWFQTSQTGIPHFDLTASLRKIAVDHGAKEISTKEYLIKLKDNRTVKKLQAIEAADKARREPLPEPERPSTELHIHKKNQYEKGEFGAVLLDRKKTLE